MCRTAARSHSSQQPVLTGMGGQLSAGARKFPKSSERNRERSLSNWERFVPETVLIIGVLVALDLMVFKGDIYGGLDPHPFWIPVLLMCAQYGMTGGLFAALVAGLTLYLLSASPQLVNQDFYTYAATLAARPAGWVACALTVGGIRSLQILRAAELNEELTEAREVARGLGGALERALAEIGALERRIAGDASTVDGVSQSLANVNPANPDDLPASLANVVQEAVGATALTIYRQAGSAMEPLVRLAAGGLPELASAPKLSNALTQRLLAGGEPVIAGGGDALDLLPYGSVLAVPIAAEASAGPLGALLIEELRPGQDAHAAAFRASCLAQAVGRLLRAQLEQQP